MLNSFIKKFSSSIKLVTKTKNPNLHEPDLNFLDILEIKKCINSNYVSTVGPQVKLFEKKLANFTQAKYVVATNSGTSALHLALKALGVDKNTEILLPTLNFVASANAILYCNATPHFVDSNLSTLSIDHKKLHDYLKKITIIRKNKCYNKFSKKKIKALILVHIFGLSGDILKIKKICKIFKIELIEDAAEGIGSYYKKKHLGTFGKIGILSFNGNKTITTGSGGAILTSNKNLAKKIYNFSLVSKSFHSWKLEYKDVGYNYRMPSLNAALGISQLSKTKEILKRKRKLHLKYKKIFHKFKEFKLIEEIKNSKSNYWLNTVILNFNSNSKKELIIKKLIKDGIQVRPIWKLLHKLKHLTHCPKMNLSNAIQLEKNIISLPSSSIYGKN